MALEISFRKTPQENAELYFSRAKKAKEKILAVEKAMNDTLIKMENVKAEEIKKLEAPKMRIRKQWFETYHWMMTSDGFLVVGGRNASQNEILFKKRIDAEDIVLHAEIHGAPLTIVKSDGKKITPLAIREAGEFAAAYSSGWKAGLAGVDVYWIKPEQVSKTPPAGQFLPKGSFMILGQKNFMKKMELKTSIGVKFEYNKEGMRTAKLIYGSVQAVNEHAKYFVTVEPGNIEQQELAKKVKNKILEKALPDDKSLIENISLDEFNKAIPAGNGSII